MRKEKLVTIGAIVLILLIAGAIIYSKTGFTGGTVKELPSEEVARWIGEHSVLYVQTGCSHCVDQENLFGVNVKYLNTINYFDNPEEFSKNNITATPTWIINGQKYEGKLSIEELKNLTGYQA